MGRQWRSTQQHGADVVDAKLTDKREAFILAYIGEARFNATRAAQIAGYSKPRQSGSENLSNPVIAARISEELKSRSATADGVLAELTDIAMADWREFIKIRTNPRTGETVEVGMDMNAKVKSLEVLAKAHGLLTDKIDLSGSLTSTVQLVGVDPGDI